MAKLKYADCLVQRHGVFPMELLGKDGKVRQEIAPGIKATHVLTADETDQKGFFFVDGTWLWSGASKEPVGVPHKHDFDHVLCFAGGHIDDPQDFQGEITVWLDGRKEVIRRARDQDDIGHYPVRRGIGGVDPASERRRGHASVDHSPQRFGRGARLRADVSDPMPSVHPTQE